MKRFLLKIFSAIAAIILTLAVFMMIVVLQSKLFVPKDYAMWVFRSPISRLVLIYMFYLFSGFALLFSKEYREKLRVVMKGSNTKLTIAVFVIGGLGIFYVLVTDVTVVTNHKIINYASLYPQGRVFSYTDVVNISTGVYGTRGPLHSRGEFYYIIEVRDGTKINLEDVGGVNNDESEYFVIQRIDRQLVKANVPKVSSMDNFQYATEHLDPIYTDKIRAILMNTK